MSDDLYIKNVQVIGVIAAAVILGAFLVLRQMIGMQRARVELQIEKLKQAPPPTPLVLAKSDAKKDDMKPIVEVKKEIEVSDLLEDYQKEDNKPVLMQIFRMGAHLPQKKVEGVEYVKSLNFRLQTGTGRILADVEMFNDSGTPVTPRFQVMLFNPKGRFICRDTILYIADELVPGEKKVETLSFPARPAAVGFFEVRRLE